VDCNINQQSRFNYRWCWLRLRDELGTGTLRNTGDQAGADDFQKFLDAIEELV